MSGLQQRGVYPYKVSNCHLRLSTSQLDLGVVVDYKLESHSLSARVVGSFITTITELIVNTIYRSEDFILDLTINHMII